MSQIPPPLYVLDTSALLTLIEDEAGVEQVLDLLEKAQGGEARLLVSFISFMPAWAERLTAFCIDSLRSTKAL